MPTTSRRLYFFGLALLMAAGPAAHAQHAPHIPLYGDAHEGGAMAPSLMHQPTLPVGAPVAARYPALLWPLGTPLGDDTFLSNYVDDDPRQNIRTDYMGGNDHLYDGHKGTDVATFNFRLMDRGIPIVAAASGVVTHTTFHYGDRNTASPYPDGGNGLGIRHDDGTRAFYWHVRTNSVVVEPSERVEAGQPLAFVASSGWTPIPHLHFELSDARDPWEGTFHTAPSLWKEQPAYVGDAPLWVMDMDVFTLDAIGGRPQFLNHVRVKERVSSPAIFGEDEPTLGFWVQLQGNRGDRYRVEIIQPDGQAFQTEDVLLIEKHRYGWDPFFWDIPPDIPHGMWIARVSSEGRLLAEKTFEVGAETQYPPRFVPVAGRSIRLDGTGYEEALRVSPLGGSVAYHLVGAPSSVQLDGATVRIDAATDQPYRSHFFQVVATDAEARTDTMWYHLVDLAKPFNPQAVPPVSRDESPAGPPVFALRHYPNPVQGATTIAYDLDAPAHVRLALYDLLGREVRLLVDAPRAAGRHQIHVEAASLPSGFYTYRLATSEGVATRPMVVVR